MPGIVQDKECSSSIVGEHSLDAKERLEGIPVHPQMPFDGYSAAFDEGSRQDALKVRFDRVPMNENNDRSQAGRQRQFQFCFR